MLGDFATDKRDSELTKAFPITGACLAIEVEWCGEWNSLFIPFISIPYYQEIV
jgi:hypothetical protein